MTQGNTVYAENARDCAGRYKVTYLVNATNTRLTKGFESPYFAQQFVRKLKHSKRCTLLSSPLF